MSARRASIWMSPARIMRGIVLRVLPIPATILQQARPRRAASATLARRALTAARARSALPARTKQKQGLLCVMPAWQIPTRHGGAWPRLHVRVTLGGRGLQEDCAPGASRVHTIWKAGLQTGTSCPAFSNSAQTRLYTLRCDVHHAICSAGYCFYAATLIYIHIYR